VFNKKLMLYRFLIITGIIILILGYFFKEVFVLYLFAIGYLLGHALNNWNGEK